MRIFGVLALALALVGSLAWPSPAQDLPAPTASDCVEIAVWSNGYHTSLSVPSSIFPDGHAVRQVLPEAPYVLIGWGDDGFYREGPGVWRGLNALVPPSPTVVHVIGAEVPVETIYRATRLQRAALSGAQARALSAFLDGEIARDETGAPIVVGPGHAGDGSFFLRGTADFHAFYVCNHWTARALRAAGVQVGSRLSYRADGVLSDLANAAPAACPPPG